MAGVGVRVLVLSLLAHVSAASYKQFGKISIQNPSFIQVLQFEGVPPSLWITEFSGNPFSTGKLYSIEDIASIQDFSQAKPTLQSSGFKWPNALTVAPKELGNYVVIPDGFLTPLKSTGAVYLMNANCNGSCSLIELTTPKTSWWYGMVVWKDMNGDGKMDIITARATKPILFGDTGGQLLWLEQPSDDPLKNVPWTEHVLVDGPDVDFAVTDLIPGDDQFEVFAAEFFAERLTLLTIKETTATVTNKRDIDTKIGSAYDVSLVDLNNDSSLELLVTNHEGDSGGGVFAYEIPKDLLNGNFTKHVLATGFKVLEQGMHQAAPGFAYAVRLNSTSLLKPSILVAGDGSQQAYLLTPLKDDFTYNMTTIISLGGVVGSIGIFNTDGWTEFFVPNYDGNELLAYTFAP